MSGSDSSADNLSQIPTIWDDIERAHARGDAAREAQGRILERYGPSIRRYLRALTGDEATADDLLQEFGRRLIEGRFRRVHPALGKFRDYLKTVLIRLAWHDREQKAKDRLLPVPEVPDVGDSDASLDIQSERTFLEIWRRTLIESSLLELRLMERATQRPFFAAIDLSIHFPKESSAELAARLAYATGCACSGDQFRKLLHEARRRFADGLLRIVECSLDRPGLDAVEDELETIGLLRFCRGALKRRRPPASV
jgi:DNA-directed RNA polymerase specialized sigma24 family protein